MNRVSGKSGRCGIKRPKNSVGNGGTCRNTSECASNFVCRKINNKKVCAPKDSSKRKSSRNPLRLKGTTHLSNPINELEFVRTTSHYKSNTVGSLKKSKKGKIDVCQIGCNSSEDCIQYPDRSGIKNCCSINNNNENCPMAIIWGNLKDKTNGFLANKENNYLKTMCPTKDIKNGDSGYCMPNPGYYKSLKYKNLKK